MAIDADIFRLAVLALLALAVILLIAVLGSLGGMRRRVEDLRSRPARADAAAVGSTAPAPAGAAEAAAQPEPAHAAEAAPTPEPEADEGRAAPAAAVVQQEDELAVEGPVHDAAQATEAELVQGDGQAAEQRAELLHDDGGPDEAEAAEIHRAAGADEAEAQEETYQPNGEEPEPVAASEEAPEPSVYGAPSTTAAQQQQVDEVVEPERTRTVDASIWEPLTSSSTETEPQPETSAAAVETPAEIAWEADDRAATTEQPAPAEAGWGADEPAVAEAEGGTEEPAEAEVESVAARADLSEFPEEQPFERDGRWWFKRGQELLVYEEQTAQWVPAPTPPPPAPVTGEAEYQPSTGVQGSFWRCPSCGAVNGSTATTCRMCFAARP